MRNITVNEFLSEDIDIREVCVLQVKEHVKLENVFKNKKRNCNVLFMYLFGKRKYVLEDGTQFFLTPGDILYVPKFACYKFNIVEGNPLDYAIAINFLMKDKNGEEVRIGNSPKILFKDTLEHYQSRFLRAHSIDVGAKTQTLLLKSAVYQICYEIFTELINKESLKFPWKNILPAIDKIESFPADDTPIPELARICGICETNFRKLFLLYTNGISPVQYRNKLRMEQAIRSLKTNEITVEQAARDAGFKDMAYFYRLYKKHKINKKHPLQ